MQTIFIQVASYRDLDLCNTLRDCIDKAEFPERLRFGIVNQFNESDAFCLDVCDYEEDDRFKIYNIEHHQSLGACWARSEVNKMYAGEDFAFQIDSHSRFIKNWDSALISSWESLGDPKAIYTSYPSPFDPNKPQEKWEKRVYAIYVYNIERNMTQQRPKFMEDWFSRKKPYRARHVAAGFIFCKGSVVSEIPYDPNFYFSGEETSLSVRFFTHGYNLYHPSELYIWHYYGREEAPKHWKDLRTGHLTRKSHDRLRSLLGIGNACDFGIYGLGQERSLEDYKKYTGIDFENNILSSDALNNIEPPIDYKNNLWYEKPNDQYIKFDFAPPLLHEAHDISFVALFLQNSQGEVVKRIDLMPGVLAGLLAGKKTAIGFPSFYPGNDPVKSFFIWPYSESKGWLTKRDSKPLTREDFLFDYSLAFKNKKNQKRNKVLIVGSGMSGLDVVKYENDFDFIVVVNNAWSLTKRWNYWIHPNDYKGSKPETIMLNQKEINANGYGSSLRKYGGIDKCGFSIMLNASYWTLDNLSPSEIGYLGADMNYTPDENGSTHFYGIGIDIKNRGISDPDYMVKARSNGDPEYLYNIYKRFEKIANQNGCVVYNLSKDQKTRLPYEKKYAF